ncbi:hypothetical protein OOK31_25550 [Streptomyces sp. NBC_00249]|uniref:hypothetical protein n=1 Tax=Streptomyces sp. NBC_00249 TaxID=2975690 RepID=UPI00225AF64B|nr:hypothetical protein [Streptomyces sp. NBC_00249]MCX5197223.1 hypothetical protein [Streptomyces sp. NBC_00249]
MPVTSDFSLTASVLQTKANDLTTTSDQLSKVWSTHLDTGTAAGQADKVFHDTRTITASSSEDLDLAAVLLDVFGAAITFARVKAVFIAAAAANANNVIVGAGTNPWATFLNATGTITLRPGESFGFFANVADSTGHTVTAATGDILKVANSGAGTSVTYDVIIVGCSA